MNDRHHEQLKKQVERQAARIRKSENEQEPLISHTLYIGTLGLLFVVPIILGAYLGHWLDDMAQEYSSTWTASLVFLGIIIGAVNVYLFIRES